MPPTSVSAVIKWVPVVSSTQEIGPVQPPVSAVSENWGTGGGQKLEWMSGSWEKWARWQIKRQSRSRTQRARVFKVREGNECAAEEVWMSQRSPSHSYITDSIRVMSYPRQATALCGAFSHRCQFVLWRRGVRWSMRNGEKDPVSLQELVRQLRKRRWCCVRALRVRADRWYLTAALVKNTQ